MKIPKIPDTWAMLTQHGEDHHVDQALEELAVVHGADAGDEAQHGGGRRVGPPVGRGQRVADRFARRQSMARREPDLPGAVRTQPAQRAFPQFWQKAVAVTPG